MFDSGECSSVVAYSNSRQELSRQCDGTECNMDSESVGVVPYSTAVQQVLYACHSFAVRVQPPRLSRDVKLENGVLQVRILVELPDASRVSYEYCAVGCIVEVADVENAKLERVPVVKQPVFLGVVYEQIITRF